MTKCDFCTMSAPDGGCFWSMQGYRESDCRKAIKHMTNALKRNKDLISDEEEKKDEKDRNANMGNC